MCHRAGREPKLAPMETGAESLFRGRLVYEGHKKTRNYAGLSDITQRLDLPKEVVAMGGLEPPTSAL